MGLSVKVPAAGTHEVVFQSDERASGGVKREWR